jgi:endonuclease G
MRRFVISAALLLGSHGMLHAVRAQPSAVAADSAVWDTLFDSVNVRKWVSCDSGLPLANDYYYDCYSARWRIPHWVVYHATRAHLIAKAARKDDFREDRRLPVAERVKPADYKRKHFDKGHLAPAADFTFDPEPMSTTFLMSNMSPQHPSTNRGIWQELEGDVRSLVTRRGEAWIVAGNLFLAGGTKQALPKKWLKRGGEDFVAVPTHLFKVVLARDARTKKLSEYAFLMPNSPKRTKLTPADFMVCVDTLEKLTGWDFFPWLEKELSTQESRIPTVWSW